MVEWKVKGSVQLSCTMHAVCGSSPLISEPCLLFSSRTFLHACAKSQQGGVARHWRWRMNWQQEENASYRDVRDRFRRAEAEGWFFPWAKSTKYPLSVTGVALEGGTHGRQSAAGPQQPYREAAVLFLMGCKARSRQLHVLITKRSTEVSSHPGSVVIADIKKTLWYFWKSSIDTD